VLYCYSPLRHFFYTDYYTQNDLVCQENDFILFTKILYAKKVFYILFINNKYFNKLIFPIVCYKFKSLLDGLSINFPFLVNLEPWQGQSQVCSSSFQTKAHPK